MIDSSVDGEELADTSAERIEQYDSDVVYDGSRVTILDISYDSYPVETVAVDDGDVIVEGCIYGPGSFEDNVDNLRDALDKETDLREWISDKDGGFVVYHVTSEDELEIVTDPLGRLPLFYSSIDGTIVGGRSIHFIKKYYDAIDATLHLDGRAISEILLMGYSFEDRTLYSQISETGPATYLRLAPGSTDRTKLIELSLDKNEHCDKSIEENGERIAELIHRTCERRLQLPGDHLISLSGGKDSRLIAAALSRISDNVTAASFYNDSYRTERDTRTAQTVAKALEMDWNMYHVRNTGRQVESLLYRKGGLNYFGIALITEFFEKILADKRGPVHYYTGDIGDLVDGSWSIDEQFASDEAAAEWLIDSNAKLQPSIVAQLTDQSEAAIRESVSDRVRSFPESTPQGRATHFLIRERGFNLDFHGEDRNRSYFWTHAPLQSWPLVRYLANVSKEQKYDYKLYKSVFDNVDPSMLEIPYQPYGEKLGSRKQLLKEKTFDLIPQHSWSRAKLLEYIFGGLGSEEQISGYIDDQELAELDTTGALDIDAVSEMNKQVVESSPQAGFNLMTITTSLEYINNQDDSTTLQEYWDTEF